MFHRLHSDGTQSDVPLQNLFAGTTPAACWIIGGGPSLAALPCDALQRSPLPKMGLNLSGARLLRPNFWTSYDPSARFHRSLYLDPSILKFLHRRRASDLVPETTFKVGDCPGTLFFERDPDRGYADFLHARHTRVVDWADTFVQAIDILFQLGFRTLYLAGCEMRVSPSPTQCQRAEAAGVRYETHGRLDEWLRAARQAGVTDAELDALDPAGQYHFDEHKPIAAAAQTDFHYFRVAQWLRLSRRAMSLAGMRLISVTPESRLNDIVPFQPVDEVLAEIAKAVGDPSTEPVRGLYRQSNPRRSPAKGPMRDFPPHNWPARRALPKKPEPPPPVVPPTAQRLLEKLRSLPKEPEFPCEQP